MRELFKQDLILDLCKNKKVLHIGATDSPYHKEKGLKGELLHQKLLKVCKELVGIDIDIESIKWLKNNLGLNNIFFGDIIKGKYEINLNKEWDYIVFGDVIEHLENPGIALDNIKKIMDKKTKLIITTPNVFSYTNLKTYITGKENVHPDHTFWPSYKTMCRLLDIKNFKIVYFTYCFWGNYKSIKTLKGRLFYKLIKNRINRLMPCLFFVTKVKQ